MSEFRLRGFFYFGARAMAAILSNSELGREIFHYLQSKLEIPEGVRAISIQFAVDEVIVINCEYAPRPKARGAGSEQ